MFIIILVVIVIVVSTRNKKGNKGALILTSTPKRTDVKPAIKLIKTAKINANIKLMYVILLGYVKV